MTKKVNLNMTSDRPKIYPDTCQDKESLKCEIKKTLKTFLQTTSLKGVSKTAKTNGMPMRIIWILGTLIGLTCALFLICNVCIAYFNYDTVVLIENCVNCKPDFPDITVCNLNILPRLEDFDILSYRGYIQLIDDIFNQYHSSQANMTNEQQIVLNEMYTTLAYFYNVDISAFWEHIISEGGLSDFVHDCTW